MFSRETILQLLILGVVILLITESVTGEDSICAEETERVRRSPNRSRGRDKKKPPSDDYEECLPLLKPNHHIFMRSLTGVSGTSVNRGLVSLPIETKKRTIRRTTLRKPVVSHNGKNI